MSKNEFILRQILGVIILVFMVIKWAIIPYAENAHVVGGASLDTYVISIFFGNHTPRGITVLMLLAARAFIGLALAFWVLVPGLRFLIDADFNPLARASVILFSGISVLMFVGSLVVHFVFYS